jgi:hypothetical protein
MMEPIERIHTQVVVLKENITFCRSRQPKEIGYRFRTLVFIAPGVYSTS